MSDEKDMIDIPELLTAARRAISHVASRMAAQGKPLHIFDVRAVASKATDAFATGRALTIDEVDTLVARALASLELRAIMDGDPSKAGGQWTTTGQPCERNAEDAATDYARIFDAVVGTQPDGLSKAPASEAHNCTSIE